MFKIIDPLTAVNYDEMLLSTPGASFFHTSAWARVLVESYRYTPIYFAEISNDQLSTLVPLMEIRSVLTGNRGVSLPMFPGLKESQIQYVIEHIKRIKAQG